MIQTPRRARPSCEGLESRRLLASAGTLLSYDFNAGTAWPAVASSSSAGVVASAAQSAVGTVDVEGTSDKTGAVALTVTSGRSGAWTSDLASGKLAVTNTETNLGKLTLGFQMSASQAKSVKVIVTSYDAAGNRSGALETTVLPAAVNTYQRYSVDLSTMTASGAGTFAPTAPFVSFNFEMGGALGWTNATTTELRVDNVQYAKPAYYVSSIDGNNNDSGRTESLAFATIQKALDAAGPGDIILVKGDAAHPYNVTAGNRNYVKNGGTPAAWMTIKNYPGQSPMIYTEGWAAIQIGASSAPATPTPVIAYVEIRGLHVKGDTLKVGTRNAPDGNYNPTAPNADQYGPYAQYLQPVDPTTGKTTGGTSDSRTNGNGLSVSTSYETYKPHDIRFADNLVEQCAGAGIGVAGDRFQVENNVVRDNCYWDKYANSGISTLSTYQFEATTSDSVNTVQRLFRNNVSSGNIHKEKWVRDSPTLTQYSDGNGIIIDINADSSSTYNFRTLVTNNLVFDNGGSGIHAFKSNHVDIVNNTSYFNSASPYLNYGMIFANQATDVRIYNNIMVAPVANTAAGEMPEYATGGTTPTSANGIRYYNNVYFGGNVQPAGANAYNVGNVTGDPKFVNASTTPAVADFHLQSTSPAINLGTTTLAPYLDADGKLHYANPDGGAYEFVPAAPAAVTLAAASDTGTAGDNRTNLNNANAAARLSFLVAGTLPGATVTLYADGVAIGTATAPAAGTTTSVATDGLAALADGAHAFTATQAFAGAPSAPTAAALSVTVDTVGPALAATLAFAVDDGTAQRSRVRSLTLSFAEAVTLATGALTLTNVTTGLSAPAFTLAASAGNTRYTLSFAGVPSLDDGAWQLALPAAAARDAAGNALAGGDATFGFHRLYGDVNGDRQVTIADFNQFAAAFGAIAPDAAYVGALDYNGDGAITIADFNQFAARFGTSLPSYAATNAIARPATTAATAATAAAAKPTAAKPTATSVVAAAATTPAKPAARAKAKRRA